MLPSSFDFTAVFKEQWEIARITHISQNNSSVLFPMRGILTSLEAERQCCLKRTSWKVGMCFLVGQASYCVCMCTLLTEPRGNMYAGLLAIAESSRLLFKIPSKLNRMCLLPDATGLILVITVAGEEEEKARHLPSEGDL